MHVASTKIDFGAKDASLFQFIAVSIRKREEDVLAKRFSLFSYSARTAPCVQGCGDPQINGTLLASAYNGKYDKKE